VLAVAIGANRCFVESTLGNQPVTALQIRHLHVMVALTTGMWDLRARDLGRQQLKVVDAVYAVAVGTHCSLGTTLAVLAVCNGVHTFAIGADTNGGHGLMTTQAGRDDVSSIARRLRVFRIPQIVWILAVATLAEVECRSPVSLGLFEALFEFLAMAGMLELGHGIAVTELAADTGDLVWVWILQLAVAIRAIHVEVDALLAKSDRLG